VTGTVTATVLNATSTLDIGGLPVVQAPNNGSNNFSAGSGALSPITTGNQNTAIGDDALAFNGAGNSNTAAGYQALYSNTTGTNNTATGFGALFSNTTGAENTATGAEALGAGTNTGSVNTATGFGAMGINTTGAANTANGAYALQTNTTGSNNTASGYNALDHNTTGGNNIAIGFQAGQNVTTTSNNIDIGSQGVAGDNGVIRIGATAGDSCTTSCQSSVYIAGIFDVTTSINDAVPVLVDASGNLGIYSSSRRYKEDIQDMGDASSGLLRLRPVTFRYKKAYSDGSQPIQYGLIAEEVAEVYPDLVARSADGQIATVKYQLLDSMLLNELQKQSATITAQKEQIGTQEQQLRDQGQQIRSLEERLAKLEAALIGAATASSR
jgi:hypothetical protein